MWVLVRVGGGLCTYVDACGSVLVSVGGRGVGIRKESYAHARRTHRLCTHTPEQHAVLALRSLERKLIEGQALTSGLENTLWVYGCVGVRAPVMWVPGVLQSSAPNSLANTN